MKSVKENIGGIIICLFEIIVGVLLLVNPIAFTSGIIIAFGIVLVLSGIGNVIKYFRTEPMEALKSQALAKGLIAILAGVFCTLQSEWFVITFPVITLIYGVIILTTGLAKIQWMVDIIRLKKKKWFLAATSAIISIVCGTVIITSPFTSTAALWTFTGAALIVEAIFDVVALIFGNKENKENKSVEIEKVDSEVVEDEN